MTNVECSKKVMVLALDEVDKERFEKIMPFLPKNDFYELIDLSDHWDNPEGRGQPLFELYEDEIDYEVDNDAFDYEYGSESGVWGDEVYNRVEGSIEIKIATREFAIPEGLYKFQTRLHYSGVDVAMDSLEVEEVKAIESSTVGRGWQRCVDSIYVWKIVYRYENNGC